MSSESESETLKAADQEAKAKTSGVKSLLAGGCGGVLSVLVGHPFDLTKVRLQTAAPGTYTGGLDVVRQTFARDGLKGFFRGMGSPLVGVTPMFAVSFWGYAMGKNVVYAATPNRVTPEFSLAEYASAGAFSALPTALVAAPMERVKVLLQVDGQGGATKLYNGPLDVLRKLYAEGGIKSIYRGTLGTIIRDAPGSAAYFVAYESTKRALTPAGAKPGDLSLSSVLIAGSAAGVAMWSIAIPPDTVKSRLQSAPAGTYKGFLDCAQQLIRNDGPTALFRGFGPAMARAIPANAAAFLGVEYSTALMNRFF